MSRIIQVTSWLSSAGGGIPPVIKALVAEFRRQQLDCVIAGLAGPADQPSVFPPDWSVIAGQVAGPAAFGYAPELARQLSGRVQKDSLIHVHGLWMYPGRLARKLAAATGAKRLVSPHGMLDPWALKNSRWKKRLAAWGFENRNLHTANCLHALCESEAEAIRGLGIKTPIAIIPNGVEIPVQSDSQTLKAETLKSPCGNPPWEGIIEPGRKVLLFLSRIHPKKGLVNLLKAWATLNPPSAIRHPNSAGWVLAIAGWDQNGHEAELKSLASELGLAWRDVREHPTSNIQHPTSDGQRPLVGMTEIRSRKSVTGISPPSVLFLGPQFNEAKAECYRHCDGFILPSFSEGVPMVVLEAWAYAKPVLITKECNLPAGFERNAAIRIEANVEDIARGLREFFEMSDAQRRTLGDNGLRLAREQFAWPHLAREMRQLYEWLSGGGPRPAFVV